MPSLVFPIALSAFVLHYYYFCWIARRAISARYPDHPDLSLFGGAYGPLGMAILLTSFRSVEVIHKLPEPDRIRIVSHYRAQLVLALVSAASFVLLSAARG